MGNLEYGFAVGLAVLCGVAPLRAQETNQGVGLRIESSRSESSPQPKVTAVYGLSADDAPLSLDTLKKRARPNIRSAASHPSFDLPDAFYFIGGPIFILLFLRVLVIFLNEFEEKSREEQRKAKLEDANPE
jgi:hypothetical protein